MPGLNGATQSGRKMKNCKQLLLELKRQGNGIFIGLLGVNSYKIHGVQLDFT